MESIYSMTRTELEEAFNKLTMRLHATEKKLASCEAKAISLLKNKMVAERIVSGLKEEMEEGVGMGW